MVYKNGIKEWAIMGCGCGLASGFIMGLMQDNMISGIIRGILFGGVFALWMTLFSKPNGKKATQLHAEISKVRKIVCEGPANHKKGANVIAGWLFLSEDAIEFYPYKKNIKAENIPILLDDILNVETQGNRLKIQTKTGLAYTFVVNKSKLWKQSITEIL